MPLIMAVVLYGGAFFGYVGGDRMHDEIKAANAVQQHWLQLKHAAIDQVERETLKGVR